MSETKSKTEDTKAEAPKATEPTVKTETAEDIRIAKAERYMDLVTSNETEAAAVAYLEYVTEYGYPKATPADVIDDLLSR